MTRPPSLLAAFIAIPGWLAAQAPPSYGRLLALAGAVTLGRAVANLVNDLLDEEKDRITAPELPLPSELVTRRQAILTACALAVLLLVLLKVAGGSWTGFFIGFGGMACGGLLVGAYSLVKPYAFVAVAVTGCAYMSVTLTAWLVAGGGWSTQVAVVLVYALLSGFAANAFATLRDVDRDGEVGNRSIAVRLGPERTLALGISAEMLATMCVLAVAVLRNRPVLGAAVVTVSLTFFVIAYLSTVSRQRVASGRHQRSTLIWPLRIARQHVGMVLVQSVPVGLIAGSIAALAPTLFSFYDRRIVQGGLRKALAVTMSRESQQPSPSRLRT